MLLCWRVLLPDCCIIVVLLRFTITQRSNHTLDTQCIIIVIVKLQSRLVVFSPAACSCTELLQNHAGLKYTRKQETLVTCWAADILMMEVRRENQTAVPIIA